MTSIEWIRRHLGTAYGQLFEHESITSRLLAQLDSSSALTEARRLADERDRYRDILEGPSFFREEVARLQEAEKWKRDALGVQLRQSPMAALLDRAITQIKMEEDATSLAKSLNPYLAVLAAQELGWTERHRDYLTGGHLASLLKDAIEPDASYPGESTIRRAADNDQDLVELGEAVIETAAEGRRGSISGQSLNRLTKALRRILGTRDEWIRAIVIHLVSQMLSSLISPTAPTVINTFYYLDQKSPSSTHRVVVHESRLQCLLDGSDPAVTRVVARPCSLTVEPRKNSGVVARLSPGAKVTVCETRHKWTLVASTDPSGVEKRGWVRLTLLRAVVPTGRRWPEPDRRK